MKHLLVFWDHNPDLIPSNLFIKELLLDRFSVVTNLPMSFYIPVNKARLLNEYDFDIINKYELMIYPSLGLDLSILEKFSKYEAEAYKVIHRHFSALGEAPSLKLIEDTYYNSLSQSYKILKNNVDAILFFDTPHYPIDFILWKLAILMKINVFITKNFPLPHLPGHIPKRYITNNFPSLDDKIINRLGKGSFNYDYDLPNEFKNYIDEYRESSSNSINYNPAHLGTRRKASFLGVIKKINSFIGSIYSGRGLIYITKRIYNQIIFIFFFDLKNRPIKKFYEKNSLLNPELNCDYIYFPLQFQPEASTNALGGVFSNQQIVIDHFLNNMPEGFKLYIREHPAYWHRKNSYETMNLSRSINFYNSLKKHSNIRLISHKTNHYHLINNSKAIITITGTVALEALAMKKACFVFGNYIYNHLPNIILPSENESIGESIQRINSIELDNYLKFFYSTLNSVSVSKSKDILPVGREEFDFIINYIKNQEVI